MPSDPQLKLPTAVEVAIFRVIDAVLRADPVLRSVVKVFRSWEGRADDKTPLSSGQAPAVRLTPRGSAEDWWAADSQSGWLFIDVELFVKGTCSDDIANLWFAAKRAMYPTDQAARNALIARLQHAGARKGLVAFSAPAFDAQGGDDGTFQATAQMKIEYRINYLS